MTRVGFRHASESNAMKMTDEQIGRLWCERNGKRPTLLTAHDGRSWRWVYDDGPSHALPVLLFDHLGHSRHHTEADAYDAVGAALRELKRRADEIAVVLGEVTA